MMPAGAFVYTPLEITVIMTLGHTEPDRRYPTCAGEIDVRSLHARMDDGHPHLPCAGAPGGARRRSPDPRRCGTPADRPAVAQRGAAG